MAPMNGTKRGRSRANTEETADDSGYAEASSHLRQRNSAHKRPRLSKPDDDDDDTSVQSSISNESGDEDSSVAGEADEDVVAEDDTTEAGNEEDSEDDYNPDISDEEAMRRYVEARKRRGTLLNHPAMCAIIEEVTCTNFMCHAHLSMSMGPLINFIIGHNGSGKSAVLTALQLCLGSRAGATNRGQSLKSLIKQGTDRATLLVRIKNQGELAYLPDLYGSSIIVERHFSQSGTSGFSIRNANGKQVSSRKSDLDDILDALALQLDNPMNVLTQDKAREFLNSTSAEAKYKFFIKGTHLEQLDTDYKVLNGSLEKNNQQLYEMEEDRDVLKKAVDKAAEKVKEAEKTNALHNKAQQVRRQIIWSQVRDREEQLAAIDEDIRETEDEIRRKEHKAEESATIYQQALQARDDAAQVLQQFKDDLKPHEEEKQRVSELFQDNKKDLLRLQTEMRDLNGELRAAKRRVETLKGQIEAEKEKLANAEDGRHGEKLAEIQAAEDEVVQLKERQQGHSADLQQLHQAVFRAQENAKRAVPAVSEKRSNVTACENTIRNLTRSNRSWQDAFNPALSNLLKAIEQNRGRFREMPVGPLGRYVSLLKPQWSSVLEKSFGQTLDGFAVTSQADQRLLTELMNRVRYPVRVYCGKAGPIDTRGNEPPAELTTWLKVLKIDNDLARNTFIVNQAIDQTVLASSQEEAAAMTMRGRINCVRQIFAINNRGGGFRFSWTGTNNQTQAPIDRWNGNTRMQTDTESRIAMERQNLANLKQDLTQAEGAQRDADNLVKTAQQTLNTHSRAAKEFVIQIQRQEEKVSRLRDELEEATPQTGLLDNYREELVKALEQETVHANQYQDQINERDRLNRTQRELKDQDSEINGKLHSAERDIQKAETRHQKFEERRLQSVLKKNEAFQSVEDAQNMLKQHQDRRERALEEVENVTAQASDHCERVPLDRGKTTADFENSYTVLQQTIERSKRINGGSREELIERHAAIKAEFDQKDEAYKEVKLTLEALGRSLRTRRDRWEKFRKYMSIGAKSAFSYLLSERNFRGDLTLDHEAKLLDMKVEPDITKESAKGRQTTTLSGGEKSFSTICLLLSIWEAMGSPIRCLDEFDVFMDQVNRDVSMKMLIDTARQSTSRQFVFITPQAMNNIRLGDDVKIHKMRDPERGQTTLPYGRA